MGLPRGFDPATLKFSPPKTTISAPRNTTAAAVSRATSYRSTERSLWDRFNNGVAELGNWFAENTEKTVDFLSGISVFGILVMAVVFLISIWLDKGFLTALGYAVVVVIVGMLGLGIVWYVLRFALNLSMIGLRLLFWNGWTLSLVGGICMLFVIWSCLVSVKGALSQPESVAIENQTYIPSTYRCTARSLNIREAPRSDGDILGCIFLDQQVSVEGEENGFGRIRFNGKVGYVSMEYLEKTE